MLKNLGNSIYKSIKELRVENKYQECSKQRFQNTSEFLKPSKWHKSFSWKNMFLFLHCCTLKNFTAADTPHKSCKCHRLASPQWGQSLFSIAFKFLYKLLFLSLCRILFGNGRGESQKWVDWVYVEIQKKIPPFCLYYSYWTTYMYEI